MKKEVKCIKRPTNAGKKVPDKLPKKKDVDIYRITERSNVIQYDCMGYPLRLCIISDGTQVWFDTYEEEGDVVLKWTEEIEWN